MAKSKIQLKTDDDYNYSTDEVVIDVKTLLKVITENNYQEGELVVEFYDDYYSGRSFTGVFLRKNN